MGERRCPVKGCTNALGVTRNGDPWLMCPKHYHRLTNGHMARLWRTYRAWQRLEQQRLRIRAEKGEAPAALLFAAAEACSSYIDVRNECIAAVADRADGLTPVRLPSLAEGLDEIQPPATRYAGGSS